jgi:phytoene dehydrogenase-like protein
MAHYDYDVLVIGGGMGGLSATGFLTKAGIKTLLVEKLPFLGGRGSSLEYKGFQISTGAGAFGLGIEEDIYKPLGAAFKVRVPNPNTIYWINNEWHYVPEKGKLRSAMTIAGSAEEADNVMRAINKAIRWKLPSSSITLREWLSQYVDDQRVLNVLRGPWQDDEITARYVPLAIKTRGSHPYGYAIGGNRANIESLVDVIKERGGEIWMRSKAVRILVEDGIVRGVVIQTKRGKEEHRIKCKAVICNGGPYKTVELAGKENFDKGYLREMYQTIKTFPWMTFHISSNEPLLPFDGIGFAVGTRIANWVLSPSRLCPELCPDGKHITYVGSWIPSQPPWNLKLYLEQALADLQDMAPKFQKCGEKLLHVAYFLRQDWPMYHSYNGRSMEQKTSIENLYNAGDGVFPEGHAGMWGAAMSGKEVAFDIEKRL